MFKPLYSASDHYNNKLNKFKKNENNNKKKKKLTLKILIIILLLTCPRAYTQISVFY